MGPNSDYDILVIKKAGSATTAWPRRFTETCRESAGPTLWSLRQRRSSVTADAFCPVICPALREGQVIYEA